MTRDEMRELLLKALRDSELIIAAEPQDDDAIGVEDHHGHRHWITTEEL